MKIDAQKFTHRFVKETIEALLYIYVILLITDKPINVARVCKLALMVGGIQAIVFLYDEETHTKIKEGMHFTVGSSFLSA